MRLGANGEIIAETGFDGGEYTPRYQDRTSVFLGDMTKEDLRVRDLIRKRNAGIAREQNRAATMAAAAARAKVVRQDALNRQVIAREAAAERKIASMKSAGYLAARAQSNMESMSPWVGSPYAGFGQKGEQRIDPDSNVDIEIVDMFIPSVEEYGVSNWMEDPSSLKESVREGATAYTPGKEVLQTMVDYAATADRSVVGLPSTTVLPVPNQQEQYDAYDAQFAPMGSAPSTINFNGLFLAGGLALAAAYFFYRRKHV